MKKHKICKNSVELAHLLADCASWSDCKEFNKWDIFTYQRERKV